MRLRDLKPSQLDSTFILTMVNGDDDECVATSNGDCIELTLPYRLYADLFSSEQEAMDSVDRYLKNLTQAETDSNDGTPPEWLNGKTFAIKKVSALYGIEWQWNEEEDIDREPEPNVVIKSEATKGGLRAFLVAEEKKLLKENDRLTKEKHQHQKQHRKDLDEVARSCVKQKQKADALLKQSVRSLDKDLRASLKAVQGDYKTNNAFLKNTRKFISGLDKETGKAMTKAIKKDPKHKAMMKDAKKHAKSLPKRKKKGHKKK